MKQIIIIFTLLFICLLEISFAPKIAIFGAIVNLPLIIMISLILIKRFDLSYWWIFSGLILDLISPTHFGIFTISFAIIYLLFFLIIKKIHYNTDFYLVIISFITGSILLDTAFLIRNPDFLLLLGNVIYNVIVGCIIYWFIKYYLEPQTIIKIKI